MSAAAQLDGQPIANKKTKPNPAWLEANLFSLTDEDTRLYAIIDGQWCRDIYGRLETYQDEIIWSGLIAGEQARELALTSPYLIRLEKGHKLTHWLLDEGWGKGWGVYFLASQHQLENYRKPPSEPHKNAQARGAFVEAPGVEADRSNDVALLRRHFRKFQRVEFEDDGRIVRFRFFDPAVLRIYLMSCNAPEIEQFFGPAIRYFISEDYCEEESLSQPHRIYHYSRAQSGPQFGKLAIKRFDTLTRQAQAIEQLSSANETAERPLTAIIPLIRNAQLKTFEQMQLEIFKEQVSGELMEADKQAGEWPRELNQARQFVLEQTARAKTYGLETEYDLKAYIYCACRLGTDFDSKLPEFSNALEAKDTTALSKLFEQYVYDYQGAT